ncbi:MAG TPA: molecular chaperone DnaJ [Candidatus Aminicenantes bacterium]|nr:molecular chaperone DnaJ [Candidatus Aminicenantes bacterium]
MKKRDYYEVLGVSRTAGADEIKKAYRQQALKFHPDRNQGDAESEEKFKEASEAYSVLGNPDKRKTYDQYGHEGLRGNGNGADFGFSDSIFADFGDILGDLFGFGSFFSGGRGGRAQRKGRDMGLEVSLTIEEAYHGTDKEISIEREKNCPECSGTGSEAGHPPETCRACGGSGQVRRSQGFFSIATPCSRCGGSGRTITHPCKKCRGQGRVVEEKKLSVTFPAGIDSGNRLRVVGEGEEGQQGGRPGDLYLMVKIEEDGRHQRQGNDLLLTVPVSFAQAALGDEIPLTTFAEAESVKIPAGTQSGQTIRIRGKGFREVNRAGRGDLLVVVSLRTPTRLSPREEALLRELRDLERGAEATGSERKKRLFH